MRVRVTYIDHDSFHPDEAIAKAKNIFGDNTDVEVLPDNSSSSAFLKYALQGIVTPHQLSEVFDGEGDMDKVRDLVLKDLKSHINTVIVENERKLME
jgi:hypothetical protein